MFPGPSALSGSRIRLEGYLSHGPGACGGLRLYLRLCVGWLPRARTSLPESEPCAARLDASDRNAQNVT